MDINQNWFRAISLLPTIFPVSLNDRQEMKEKKKESNISGESEYKLPIRER